jgi:hypothetical protein
MSFFDGTESPLDTLKTTLGQMLEMSETFTIRLPPIPVGPVNRVMDLEQISSTLSDRATNPILREMVWGQIVRKAHRGEAGWTIVAGALARVKLAHKAGLLAVNFDGDRGEDEADLIEAFIAAVRDLDVMNPRWHDLGAQCAWRAYQVVRQERRREAATAPVCLPLNTESCAPAPKAAHPDILLARAVRAGVLSSKEAEYIGRSYLEDTSVEEILAWAGISRAWFFECRAKAEARLVAAIRGGVI